MVIYNYVKSKIFKAGVIYTITVGEIGIGLVANRKRSFT